MNNAYDVFNAIETATTGKILRIDAQGEEYDIFDFCGAIARHKVQFAAVSENEAWIVDEGTGVLDPTSALRGLPLLREKVATLYVERLRRDEPEGEEYPSTEEVDVYRVRVTCAGRRTACFLASEANMSLELRQKAIEMYPRHGVVLLPMEELKNAQTFERLREIDDDLR